jgi:hypothetical protein
MHELRELGFGIVVGPVETRAGIERTNHENVATE